MQDAIDELVGGGTIRVHPGTYTGPRNRDLDFLGKTVVLESVAGPDSTIIDCEGLGRAFNFHSQEDGDCFVDGFTIRNGLADDGGAVRCDSTSSPNLQNLIIENCTATGDGGGIWVGAGAAPSLTYVTIVDCSASRGGGVHCDAASPVLDGVTLHRNWAIDGGGVSCAMDSSPEVTSTIISGSGAGGAVYCERSDASSFSRCCIFGNAGGDSLCGSHEENLFVRPRYCDPDVSELTLRDDSPCLGKNNPWDEQIGAWGPGDCSTGIADGEHTEDVHAGGFAFLPPVPNPAPGEFDLTFQLLDRRSIDVRVYSVTGRLVRTLESPGEAGPGVYTVRWDGLDGTSKPVPSGIYFVMAEVAGRTQTQSAVVVR
jgi:hypothetical protein